jgi:large subunit ribosomal protein L5
MTTAVQAPRLLEKYRKEVAPALKKEFGYTNEHAIPFVKKIVINMGVKEGTTDVKIIDQAAVELSQIAGQKPVITRAKKSIAGFKVRAGQPVGLKVTLRRQRMYEFMDRLFNVALPRVRDFRGLPENSFDGQGNYTFGLAEQGVFPEILFDKVNRQQGMDITFNTSAKTKEEARQLLLLLGMPFRK